MVTTFINYGDKKPLPCTSVVLFRLSQARYVYAPQTHCQISTIQEFSCENENFHVKMEWVEHTIEELGHVSHPYFDTVLFDSTPSYTHYKHHRN